MNEASINFRRELLDLRCLSRPPRRRGDAAAPVRRQAAPCDPVGLSYFVASRRLAPEQRRRLRELGAALDRGGCPPQLLRELLLAAGAEQAVDQVARLAALASFRRLDPPTRVAVVRAAGTLASWPGSIRALLALVESGMLAALSLQLKSALLRHLQAAGITSRTRHAALLGWHDTRAPELERWTERGGAADALAFLDEVVRPLHVLVDTSTGGERAFIVFGDLSDPSDPSEPSVPRSWSYEKSAEFDSGGRYLCRVFGSSPPRAALYSTKSTLLSRLEELELIAWLEHNYLIDGEAGFRAGRLRSAFQLEGEVEAAARVFSARRGGADFAQAILRRTP